MIAVWNSPTLLLTMEGDEILLVQQLLDTRGQDTFERELEHFFHTRLATVREEMKKQIIDVVVPNQDLQSLRDKMDELGIP